MKACDGHRYQIATPREVRAVTGWRRFVSRKFLNLVSPDIVVTSVSPRNNKRRLEHAEHWWIIIVAELILSQTVAAYETISSLKSQALSSESDPALRQPLRCTAPFLDSGRKPSQ